MKIPDDQKFPSLVKENWVSWWEHLGSASTLALTVSCLHV